MPKYQYVALGSNTTVKSGTGQVYGVTIGGANGATVLVMDAISIGTSPDYNAVPRSVASNIAVITGVGATPFSVPLHGAQFGTGLVIAATSNAPVSVFYD